MAQCETGAPSLTRACLTARPHLRAAPEALQAPKLPPTLAPAARRPARATQPQAISFWFEYLARGPFAALAAEVALVPPATAYLLQHTDPTTAAELLAPLELRAKQLVLLAVSDNPDVGHAGGGSHWSLLAFDRRTNVFLHLDSAPGGGGNRGAARQLAGALSPLVRDQPAAGGGSSGQQLRLPRFEEVEGAPRQENGYDCGVYVMALARQLCALYAEAPGALGAQLPRLREAVTPAAVRALRQEARQLVLELAATGGGG